MTNTHWPRLRLRKNEDRRVKSGHLWIFSNEIDTTSTPLTFFSPGDMVAVESARGEFLGIAYVNPSSLIAARIVSYNSKISIDSGFFIERIQRALALREWVYGHPYYRLAYGESDALPGLIIDRFHDVFVVQTNTAGMERLQSSLLEALDSLFSPRAIVLKNTSSLRTLEGLPLYTQIATGHLDERLRMVENGTDYFVDILEGQKTGWFFDHRDNRAQLRHLCRGRTVLDLFSYTGAWGIVAARSGATRVDCVEVSSSALSLMKENACLNGVSDRLIGIEQEVFMFLKQAREERYDVIIVDPPAFIKRKKDLHRGTEAYHRLHQAALRLLNKRGILISASCSFHLHRETLRDILRISAHQVGRSLLFFDQGGQAQDHPVHPAIPETEYLKAFFCYVE